MLLQHNGRLQAEFVPFGVNLAIAVALFGTVSFLYSYFPASYIYLSLEDGAIEYGSFVAWVVAICLFIWRSAKAPRGRKVTYLFFAVVAFVMAMEEISWGQRLMGWESAEFFKMENRQSETNFHNLISINKVYEPVAILIVLACVLPWTVTRLSPRLARFCEERGLPVVAPGVWPVLFLAALFLGRQPFTLGTEIGELILPVEVALFALDLLLSSGPAPRASWRIVGAPLLLLSTIFMGTLVICVVSASQREGKGSRRLNQFAVARFRKGQYRQAEQLFDFIRQRPELPLDSTDFYYGVLLVATDRAEEARSVLSQFIQESERFLSEETEFGGDRERGQRLRMMGYSHCVADDQQRSRSASAGVRRGTGSFR
jgi:hypothetical protein